MVPVVATERRNAVPFPTTWSPQSPLGIQGLSGHAPVPHSAHSATSTCWYHPVAVDGGAITDPLQPTRYALQWRRIQRLQWPHVLQMCARHQPLQLEPEVLYIVPTRFPYSVFLLLTDKRLILISTSMMDYATCEQYIEFAMRLHRPLWSIAKHIPANFQPHISTNNTHLGHLGRSLAAQGLPTFGEFLKHVSHTFDSINRAFTTHHLHITPSHVVTNLDSDLQSIHWLRPQVSPLPPSVSAGTTTDPPGPSDCAWTRLLGASRAARLEAAHARWRARPEVAATWLDAVLVSPVTWGEMIKAARRPQRDL